MNFNISEINSWYKTEAGKINKDLVVDSINNIILDRYDRSILYIGPSDITKKIMKKDKSFNSFFVSTSKYSDVKAEIENLPFQKSSIDLVVLVHSLEINKDPCLNNNFKVPGVPGADFLQRRGVEPRRLERCSRYVWIKPRPRTPPW